MRLRTNLNLGLAAAAGALALGALLAGDPPPAAHAGTVAPLELAQWIHDRKNVLIVDLRSPEDYALFHLPTAQNDTVGAGAHELVVFYGDGDVTEPPITAQEGRQVLLLRDGVFGWLDEVMNPVLPPDPTPDQRAAFKLQSQLSEYFGGEPSIFGGEKAPASTEEAVKRMKRRGC